MNDNDSTAGQDRQVQSSPVEASPKDMRGAHSIHPAMLYVEVPFYRQVHSIR